MCTPSIHAYTHVHACTHMYMHVQNRKLYHKLNAHVHACTCPCGAGVTGFGFQLGGATPETKAFTQEHGMGMQ